MRVIAGKFKGFNLKGASGLNIRPTTDRVKEALFNIIGSKIEGSHFVDLFSGYGNVGIEALSRGANYVVFVDNNKKCINILKKNLSHLQTENFQDIELNFKVLYQDVTKFISKAHNMFNEKALWKKEGQNKFDFIFMDPPYHSDLIQECLFKIDTYDILKTPGGLIIAEASKNRVVSKRIGNLRKFREEVYGYSKLVFFK